MLVWPDASLIGVWAQQRRGTWHATRRYGDILRERRLAAGLTQRELAEAGRASVAAIRDLEQGRTRRPRPALAGRLVRALRLDGQQAADLLSAGRDPGPSWRQAEQDGTTGLRLCVLGTLAAWRDGEPVGLGGQRQRTVLGLLAVHHPAGLSREALIDSLWPDRPPVTATSLVQAYVSRLRRELDPGRPPRDPRGLLTSAFGRYALQPTAGQLDLLAFGDLAGRAAEASAAGNPDDACALYEHALMLWRGDPLEDLVFLRGHPAVVGVGRARAAVVIRYADTAFRAGRADRVLPYLRDLAWRDPLDEAAHAQLMIALAATGQQASALRVYAAIRDRLDRQLGVCPGRALSDAQLRVLRQDVPAGPPAAGCGVRICGVNPDRPRQLPAAATPFTGRTAELKQLTGLLLQDPGPAIAVISGMPGVGKTTLALHWAHLVADRFPDGQLYVDLRGFDPVEKPVRSARAVGGFLRALGVRAGQIPADADARAGLYRSLVAGRRLLFVVDNARDAAQVRPLLPGASGCSIVVTSRRKLSRLVADGALLICLDLPGEAEAKALLVRRLGPGQAAGQSAALAELIALCGRLPLALSLAAAAAAARPGDRLDALAAELRDARSRLDALDGADAAAGLRRAFLSSYRNLSAPGARVFRLLGTHEGRDISAPDAAELIGITPELAGEALRELACNQLVTEHAPRRFTMHDLLRAFAAAQDSPDPDAGRGL